MNTQVQVVLPYPPSANAYWRLFAPKGKGKGRPRVIVSELGRVYKEAVADLVRPMVARVLSGPIRVHADVFRPIARRDLDNNPKVLLDAIKGALFVDDDQLFRMTFEHWDHAPDLARVQLTIEEDFSDRTRPRWWPLAGADELALLAAETKIEAVAEKDRARAREKRKAKKEGQAMIDSMGLGAAIPPGRILVPPEKVILPKPAGPSRPKTLTKDRAAKLATPAYRKGP